VVRASYFTYQMRYRVNKAFPDMGVITKYDQIEPIYLPQSLVTYIYLHPVYAVYFLHSVTTMSATEFMTVVLCRHIECLFLCGLFNCAANS
jgi:hypothetical protein